MSQLGGVRHCCLWAVPPAMALLGATVAGCEYQDGSTPAARATPSAPVMNPLAGPPTKPAEVAVLEQGNRTKLDEVLGVPVPDTYLDVTEAISGRMTSYLTRASLPASGTYVITTACIGTTNARLVLSQRKPGNASGQVDFSEAFSCAEPSSRTLDLNADDVTVDVINLSPDGSTWGTGAFANVRITSWKP